MSQQANASDGPAFPWLWIPIPFLMLVALSPRTALLDDAYITLHNARVLLSGHPDPVYGSSYLAGATSLVHLALTAVLSSTLEPVRASVLLSLIGATLYAAGITRIAVRAGLTGTLLWITVLIGVCAGSSFLLYTNGLETSLGMAAAAWMLVWCDDRKRLPIVAGIAPFIRPELGLLSVLLLVRLGWALPRRDGIHVFVVAALSAAPWLAWSVVVTGELIPSTVSAKRLFYPATWTFGRRLLMTFFSFSNTNQLALFIGMAGLAKVRAGVCAAIFVLGGMIVSFITFPDAANWDEGRYTAIYFPVFMAGIAAIAAERSRLSGAVTTLLVAWSIYAGAKAVTQAYERLHRPLDGHAAFVASLPATSVVLIHDAGQVAWAAPSAKLVDMVGLKTPDVIPINKQFRPKPCEFTQSLNSIIGHFKVTHVALRKPNLTGKCVARNLQSAGWRLTPVYDNGEYAVYKLSKAPTGSIETAAPLDESQDRQ